MDLKHCYMRDVLHLQGSIALRQYYINHSCFAHPLSTSELNSCGPWEYTFPEMQDSVTVMYCTAADSGMNSHAEESKQDSLQCPGDHFQLRESFFVFIVSI